MTELSGFPTWLQAEFEKDNAEIAALMRERDRPGIDRDSEAVITAEIDRLMAHQRNRAALLAGAQEKEPVHG